MTAEDWIAFSQLINSNTFTQYKGKTLDDFGETMNGITTYYLLNDIDFKDGIITYENLFWLFNNTNELIYKLEFEEDLLQVQCLCN